jgi:hypothetical protein
VHGLCVLETIEADRNGGHLGVWLIVVLGVPTNKVWVVEKLVNTTSARGRVSVTEATEHSAPWSGSTCSLSLAHLLAFVREVRGDADVIFALVAGWRGEGAKSRGMMERVRAAPRTSL